MEIDRIISCGCVLAHGCAKCNPSRWVSDYSECPVCHPEKYVDDFKKNASTEQILIELYLGNKIQRHGLHSWCWSRKPRIMNSEHIPLICLMSLYQDKLATSPDLKLTTDKNYIHYVELTPFGLVVAEMIVNNVKEN